MDGPVNREVRAYPGLEALSRGAAEEVVRLAAATVAGRGHVAMVLAGGHTPRPLYQLLAGEYRERIPWPQVHLFWGDERCVPPDHPDSNFALAYETLISKVLLPSENIHRVPVELDPPEKAALAYEQVLRGFFHPSSAEGRPFPSFDLILLGVGEDGHTASLFPDDPVLEEKRRWVVAVRAPAAFPPPWRITLTLPVLNHAKSVVFLVSGSGKGEVVRRIMSDPEAACQRYPAAMVHPRERLFWLIEKEIYC